MGNSTNQQRVVQNSVQAEWGYNVTVLSGGIDAVTVSNQRASIGNVPYTANLSVQLATGASFLVPVQGTYEGVAYSPIVRRTHRSPATCLRHLLLVASIPACISHHCQFNYYAAPAGLCSSSKAFWALPR